MSNLPSLPKNHTVKRRSTLITRNNIKYKLYSPVRVVDFKSPSMLQVTKNSSFYNVGQHARNSKILSLRILSNWGDPEKTSLSTILVKDKKNQQIPITQILIGHSNIISGKYLDLVNQILEKDDSVSIFTFSWPPIDSEYVIITMIISEEYDIRGIRLWNAAINPQAGVKDYELYIGSEMISKGEIPLKFGLDVHYTPKCLQIMQVNSMDLLKDLFPEPCTNPPLIDKFGRYPLSETEKLVISIESNYSGEERFGINGFRIYDQNYYPIQWNFIKDIKITNCKYAFGLEKLFRENLISSNLEDMFFADTTWELSPQIEIIFHKPIRVICIDVWNYNSFTPSLKAGINKLKIFYGDRLIWNGRAKISDGGDVKTMSKKITHIPLIDIPKFLRHQ